MPLIRAVILDWAGTAVDRGSLAPIRAIQRVLERHGIAVPDAAARRDMGLPKRAHLRRLLAAVDRDLGERDFDAVYAEYVGAQLDLLAEHSDPIPGVVDAVGHMRERGYLIGSTTGYTREMLDIVAARAKALGYAPDCAVTPEEAGA